MAMNLEQVATQVMGVSAPTAGFVRALWDRAVGSLYSTVCGLHGHDSLLQVDNGRMFLKCTTCGYETPGWSTSGRGPRQRFAGDAARHRLN